MDQAYINIYILKHTAGNQHENSKQHQDGNVGHISESINGMFTQC